MGDPWDTNRAWQPDPPGLRYFLKYGNVRGQSKHPKYKEWVEAGKYEYVSGPLSQRRPISGGKTREVGVTPPIRFGPIDGQGLVEIPVNDLADQQLLYREMLQGAGVEATVVTVTAEGAEIRRTVHYECMITNMANYPQGSTTMLFDVGFTKSNIMVVLNLPDLLAAPAQAIGQAVRAITRFKAPAKRR